MIFLANILTISPAVVVNQKYANILGKLKRTYDTINCNPIWEIFLKRAKINVLSVRSEAPCA